MRWLFWFITLFALAIALALGARLNDGYVLIVAAPWRIELSLNFFLLAAVLSLLLGYALVRLLFLMVGLPARARAYQASRRREQAYRQLRDALRLLFEGRLGQALRTATAAHESREIPGLAALIAARAAQGLREEEKQAEWLRQACEDDPECEVAAGMLEADMRVDMRDYPAALAILEKLQKRHGRHIAAVRLELRARRGEGDWDEVLRLIRLLEKRDALTQSVTDKLRQEAHLGNLRSRADDAAALRRYLSDLPEEERSARLALEAARALQKLGEDDAAAGVIEEAMAEAPAGDDESDRREAMVVLYGRLAVTETVACIARAESWLLTRPRDASLLLALGRLCQRQRLWGKAQSYLEASLAMRNSAEAHLQLARMYDALERPELANRHFRLSIDAQEKK